MFGGAISGSIRADVYLGGYGETCCAMYGTSHETSRALLETSSNSLVSKGFTIDACRFSGDTVILEQSAISWQLGGRLCISNSAIGGSATWLRIAIGGFFLLFGDDTYAQVSFINSVITSSFETIYLFNGVPPNNVINTRHRSLDPITGFNRLLGQNSIAPFLSIYGTQDISFGHSPVFRAAVIGDLVLTFVDNGVARGIGTEQMIFLLNSGSSGIPAEITFGDTITWPQGMPWQVGVGEQMILHIRRDVFGNYFGWQEGTPLGGRADSTLAIRPLKSILGSAANGYTHSHKIPTLVATGATGATGPIVGLEHTLPARDGAYKCTVDVVGESIGYTNADAYFVTLAINAVRFSGTWSYSSASRSYDEESLGPTSKTPAAFLTGTAGGVVKINATRWADTLHHVWSADWNVIES